MLEVVIKVKPTKSWLTDLASKYDTEVRVHDCAPFREGGAQGLIEINARADDASEIIEELHSHPDVSGLHLVHSEEGKIIVSVTTREWVACSTILNLDC
ncbi:MAG: hypothetical protein LUO85_02315, partial [Methanomassiliicoccales archaeon]|nr:hypothetical protein [Methanomassiliicoccales archaeon]